MLLLNNNSYRKTERIYNTIYHRIDIIIIIYIWFNPIWFCMHVKQKAHTNTFSMISNFHLANKRTTYNEWETANEQKRQKKNWAAKRIERKMIVYFMTESDICEKAVKLVCFQFHTWAFIDNALLFDKWEWNIIIQFVSFEFWK